MTDQDRITYACSRCGATDCKLWRLAQTFDPDLLCAPCAGKDQDEVVDNIDGYGRTTSIHTGNRTPTIGWYVPAVPTPDWTTYWGYTSIPDEGLIWWRYLPSLPVAKSTSDTVPYMCSYCMVGSCHRCTGCTCADDNHGGLLPPHPPEPFMCTAIRGCTIATAHNHSAWEINTRRLDAIADGTERGDPMG